MNPDHYATLGLKPSATATQIKAAYRTHAKAAHPDAGGSVEAMARVNEAYRVLGDPAARREYDNQGSINESRHPNTASSESEGNRSPSGDSYFDHAGEAADFEAAAKEADTINRDRVIWARNSAWELARFSAPSAVGAIIIVRLIAIRIPNPSARLIIDLLAFIPIYALALSVVFLLSPPLRLVFADLVRRFHTTKHERIGALAIILAFFPLAAIWLLLT